jgi:beta-galactosidase
VTVDFAAPDADLSSYRLVVVPSLYLVSDEAAANLAAYVENGGQLLVGYFSGIVDPDVRVRLGGYPGAFADLLGVRVEEFHPLEDEVELASGGRGRLWSEDVEAVSAEVVDRYAGGVLDGKPAVTRRQVGDGTAWYVSTELDDRTAANLVTHLVPTVEPQNVAGRPAESARPGAEREAAGVHPGGVLETVRRRGGDTLWTFFVNHGGSEVVVPAVGIELVSGTAVDGELVVPGGGYSVLREG